MHVAVAIASLILLLVLLSEFFVVFLLPRRVKRDPRIARLLLRALWVPWRGIAGRFNRATADTMLGIFGPFGLLAILSILSAGTTIAYAGLLWAGSVHLGGSSAAGFGTCLYTSAGIFASASTAAPSGALGHVIQVVEAANGLGFLAIAIGYLPALFQAFSTRETAVSRLDPRAGSPPSASALLESIARRGGWAELGDYLREWETWTAELMETHLSYPVLGYFRSQHVNQNWLGALTTIVDACAYAMAFGPTEEIEAAELTFRIGRHALADLAFAFAPKDPIRPEPPVAPRLTEEGLIELRDRLRDTGLDGPDSDRAAARLLRLRTSYEGYAISIARHLALQLSDWLPEDIEHNWRLATSSERQGQHGQLH